MRRVFAAALFVVVAGSLVPSDAWAQSRPQGGRPQQEQQREEDQEERTPRIAPLARRANAGPCPYVKVLYDAGRYVELADNRAAAANVGFTGEIEGVNAGCAYQSDQPITVVMNMLFNLGRGPRAEGDQKTYRYWVAVTERNSAVLAKEYFDLPVVFEGRDRTTVSQDQTVVIPRAEATTSGGNFEILIGFDVTPEMAEFNRNGSRFRINAGQSSSQPAGQPPAQ